MAFKRSGVRFPSPPWLAEPPKTAVWLRGNSSVGRAQPCQGWGRGFESRFPLSGQAGNAGQVAVIVAGWSSLVARRAHNPEVVGSNPTPAIGKDGEGGDVGEDGGCCSSEGRPAVSRSQHTALSVLSAFSVLPKTGG